MTALREDYQEDELSVRLTGDDVVTVFEEFVAHDYANEPLAQDVLEHFVRELLDTVMQIPPPIPEE